MYHPCIDYTSSHEFIGQSSPNFNAAKCMTSCFSVYCICMQINGSVITTLCRKKLTLN